MTNFVNNKVLKSLYFNRFLLLSQKLSPAYTPSKCELCDKRKPYLKCNRIINCYNCYNLNITKK